MKAIYRKICTGISFSKGNPVLDIFCRDAENNRHCIKVFGLPCYFYVDENEHIEEDDMKGSVIGEYHGFTSLFGRKLKKVKVRKISEVRKLGRTYHGFESDMKWDKKSLLDLKITDKFVYDNGKAYTLDDRFSILNSNENESKTEDGLSVSTVVEDTVNKQLVAEAKRDEKILSESTPPIGEKPFEIRTVIFDIEVIVDKRDDLRTYNGKIVCVVMWDSYTRIYHRFKLEGSEKELIIKVLEKFKQLDPDLISGWNVDFDMNWIINRADYYNIDLSFYFIGGKTWVNKYTDSSGNFHEDINLGGRILIDGMELYKKRTMTTEKLSSYSLKFVAVTEGFPEWEDLGARIKELWSKDPDRIVDYCETDVQRTKDIMYKLKLLEGALTTCMFFGCGFDDVNTNSKVIESMAFLLKRDRILPNIVRGRSKPNVEGAVVLDTISGLHNNVGIFDAASLYPSIIVGLNISPECLVPGKDLFEDNTSKCATVKAGENTHHFLKKQHKLGLMAEVTIEMRKLREQIRANRQEATKRGDDKSFSLYNDQEKVAKGVLASIYGVMGFKDFRLFNEDCANSITAVGRGMIAKIKSSLENEEFKVIYGDTDSVFIKTKGLESGLKAKDLINKMMPEYLKEFGVEDPVIEVNFEKLFRWILFIKKVSPKRKTKLWKRDAGSAKKAYIGYINYKESAGGEMKPVSELYYRGVALRRSDSALVLKSTMKRFFELMEDGYYKRSIDLLKETYKSFNKLDKRFVAMPRSINEEEANNPWANGMRYSKEHLGFEFNDDEMPKLLYVKNQYKYPATDVICYQEGHEIPSEFEIDYDIMFNKLIRAKFEPIVESLGLSWDTQIGNQASLEAWM